MPKGFIDPSYAMILEMRGMSEGEIRDAVERFGDNYGTYDMLSEMEFGVPFDELEGSRLDYDLDFDDEDDF
ncbi:MAG: hypothetical protein IJG64_03140 [Oscillospiraceae bacterium]|nr:hypothetical protein [Oscillospiraceae bacterium]